MASDQVEYIYNETIHGTFDSDQDKEDMILSALDKLEGAIFDKTSAIKHDTVRFQ